MTTALVPIPSMTVNEIKIFDLSTKITWFSEDITNKLILKHMPLFKEKYRAKRPPPGTRLTDYGPLEHALNKATRFRELCDLETLFNPKTAHRFFTRQKQLLRFGVYEAVRSNKMQQAYENYIHQNELIRYGLRRTNNIKKATDFNQASRLELIGESRWHIDEVKIDLSIVALLKSRHPNAGIRNLTDPRLDNMIKLCEEYLNQVTNSIVPQDYDDYLEAWAHRLIDMANRAGDDMIQPTSSTRG